MDFAHLTLPFHFCIANVIIKVISVQMGTLMCDSLDDAEDADLLQFAVSAAEVSRWICAFAPGVISIGVHIVGIDGGVERSMLPQNLQQSVGSKLWYSSPALQRHLHADSCDTNFRAWRSRYITAMITGLRTG